MDQPKPRLTLGKGPVEKPVQEKEEAEYVPTSHRLLIEPIDVSAEDIEDARVQNRLAWGMLAALVLVGVLIGISIATRPPVEPEEVATAPETPEPPPPDSAAQAASATPETEPASPAPATPPPPKPAPAPQTAATTTTTVQPIEATPPKPFGIVVGSYLNEARAQEEATKLKGSTSLEAKIEPYDDGGVPAYRVVLGSFPNRAAAERKANDLIGQDLVYEARVAPLK